MAGKKATGSRTGRKRAIPKRRRSSRTSDRTVTLLHNGRAVTLSRRKAPAADLMADVVIVLNNHALRKTRLAWAEMRRPSGRNSSADSKKNSSTKGDHLADPWPGVAHPIRRQIVRRLLGGTASHREIRELSKQAAGPLYHHVHQLERAGLVVSVHRNQYELTQQGVWFGMSMIAVEKTLAAKDRKLARNQSKRG